MLRFRSFAPVADLCVSRLSSSGMRNMSVTPIRPHFPAELVAPEIERSVSLATASAKELLKYKKGLAVKKQQSHITDTGSASVQSKSSTLTQFLRTTVWHFPYNTISHLINTQLHAWRRRLSRWPLTSRSTKRIWPASAVTRWATFSALMFCVRYKELVRTRTQILCFLYIPSCFMILCKFCQPLVYANFVQKYIVLPLITIQSFFHHSYTDSVGQAQPHDAVLDGDRH